MSKQKDLFCNLANYEHKHIYLFHAMLSSECKIKFCSRTCKNPHLKCNYESTLLEFIISSEHKHKNLYMDIKKEN